MADYETEVGQSGDVDTTFSVSKSLPDLPTHVISAGCHVPFSRATSIHVCDYDVLARYSTNCEYGSSEDCCADSGSKVNCMPICRILTKTIDTDAKSKKLKSVKRKTVKVKLHGQATKRNRITKGFGWKRGKDPKTGNNKDQMPSESQDVNDRDDPELENDSITQMSSVDVPNISEGKLPKNLARLDAVDWVGDYNQEDSEIDTEIKNCSLSGCLASFVQADGKDTSDEEYQLATEVLQACGELPNTSTRSSTESPSCSVGYVQNSTESPSCSIGYVHTHDDIDSSDKREDVEMSPGRDLDVEMSPGILCALFHAASIDAHLDQSQLIFDRGTDLLDTDVSSSLSDTDSDIPSDTEVLSLPHMGELKYHVICEICYESKSLYQRCCCQCSICDSCMNTYCEYVVQEGKIKFPCPSSQCSQPILQCEVFARLDQDHKDKLYRYLINANTDPCKKTCPRCSEILLLDSVDELQKKKVKRKGLKVTCASCGLDWCFPCQGPWHSGISCKRNRKGDALLKKWAKEMKAGQVNARQCPKCKIFIQRSTGCDHMTCSKCGISFCYRCGERFRSLRFLGNHYSRLGIFGCKYQLLPRRPVLRKLIRGTIFGAELVVLPVVGALALVAGVTVLAGAAVASPILVGLSVRRYRLKVRRRRERQEFLEHERLRRERIRNLGDPYLENYQHLEEMGISKIWEHVGRTTLTEPRPDATVED